MQSNFNNKNKWSLAQCVQKLQTQDTLVSELYTVLIIAIRCTILSKLTLQKKWRFLDWDLTLIWSDTYHFLLLSSTTIYLITIALSHALTWRPINESHLVIFRNKTNTLILAYCLVALTGLLSYGQKRKLIQTYTDKTHTKKVGSDQEKAQSERNSLSKNRGKKNTN